MRIRVENEQDENAVRAVNESAFETSAESNLVAKLRKQARPLISLVAEVKGTIVGHIMFTPVVLAGHPKLRIMGLGPMAVSRAHQRKGIGTELVCAGFKQCKSLGFGAVVVLGHPEYYSRFGFMPATHLGISCEYQAPVDAFMIIELESDYLGGSTGKIKYNPAFDDV